MGDTYEFRINGHLDDRWSDWLGGMAIHLQEDRTTLLIGPFVALAALLESGDVKVVIDKVYPLSEAANAVAHMLGHHAIGKVVIAV